MRVIIKFGGNKNYFQEGVVITCNGIVGLFEYLKCKHGFKFLMCSHCDQDYTESFVGDMRKGGQVRKPTPMQLVYRVKRHSSIILPFFLIRVFFYFSYFSNHIKTHT